LPELKNKLEQTEGYNGAKALDDDHRYLPYCCQFDLLSNEYVGIVVAIKNLFYCFQTGEHQSNTETTT